MRKTVTCRQLNQSRCKTFYFRSTTLAVREQRSVTYPTANPCISLSCFAKEMASSMVARKRGSLRNATGVWRQGRDKRSVASRPLEMETVPARAPDLKSSGCVLSRRLKIARDPGRHRQFSHAPIISVESFLLLRQRVKSFGELSRCSRVSSDAARAALTRQCHIQLHRSIEGMTQGFRALIADSGLWR